MKKILKRNEFKLLIKMIKNEYFQASVFYYYWCFFSCLNTFGL